MDSKLGTNSWKLFIANISPGYEKQCLRCNPMGVLGCPAQWTKDNEMSISGSVVSRMSISGSAASSSGDPSAEDRKSLQCKSYPTLSSGERGSRLRVEGAGRFVA